MARTLKIVNRAQPDGEQELTIQELINNVLDEVPPGTGEVDYAYSNAEIDTIEF
jgi:hypothetical protein